MDMDLDSRLHCSSHLVALWGEHGGTSTSLVPRTVEHNLQILELLSANSTVSRH